MMPAKDDESASTGIKLGEAEIISRVLLLAQVVEGTEARQAAQGLVDHFADSVVPPDVSRVAGNLMVSTPDPGIRVLAARLYAAGTDSVEIRSEKMLLAISRTPRDRALNDVFIDMFEPDQLQEFVIRYATNPNWPPQLRGQGIQRLGKAREAGQKLSDEAHDALLAAALMPGMGAMTINQTLKAWDKEALTATYRSREEARFKIWFSAWAVAVVVLGPAAFFTVLSLSSRLGQDSDFANLHTIWTVFSGIYFVGGAFFIFALYGFGMSHGSGIPSNADSIAFTVPFIYLAIATIWGYVVFRARRIRQ